MARLEKLTISEAELLEVVRKAFVNGIHLGGWSDKPLQTSCGTCSRPTSTRQRCFQTSAAPIAPRP
jgi:hypothetical protein